MGSEVNFDHELLHMIRDNDEEFLRVLFRLYYSPLCSYACTFVKVADIAEEIVQETFIDLWEKRSDLEVNRSFRAYIYRSVHNNCINHLRHSAVLKRKSERLAAEILYHHEIAIRNFTPEIIGELTSGEMERKLTDALDSLPPQARRIFTMNRFDSLSYNEIATSLNISVNTVKTQMKRTLARLRELFMQK